MQKNQMHIKYLTKSGRLIETEKTKPSAHLENLRILENNLELKSLLEKFALEEIEKFICKFEGNGDSYMHSGTIAFEMCKQANLPQDSFHHGLAGSVLNSSLENFPHDLIIIASKGDEQKWFDYFPEKS